MNNKLPNQLNIHNLIKTKWADQFNKAQLEQIKIGLESNIDVSIYANILYNWEQMFEIREGLEDGLNVTIYANPEINQTQMGEIRSKLGIEWK